MINESKIMVISAHPADFCSRSGGTLIKHVQAGHGVKVVFLTHGETDESNLLYEQQPDISLDEVRLIREKEAFACADIIGAEAKMFGFGDNPLRMTEERIEILAHEIKNYDPDIIPFLEFKPPIAFGRDSKTGLFVEEEFEPEE